MEEEDKSENNTQNSSGFGQHIASIMRQVHRDLAMSPSSVHVMEDFIEDMLKRVIGEAKNLLELTNKKKLTTKDLETCLKLMLPGELGVNTINEGRRAVEGYDKNKPDDK